MPKIKKVLATYTGELIQPVRLNYKIINETEVLDKLNKTRDFHYDKEKNLYKWIMKSNEKKYGFKIDKNVKISDIVDIILGYIKVTGKKLHIILSTVNRAKIAITFLDKNIGKEFAEIETLDLINKIFEFNLENVKEISNLENIFENKIIKTRDTLFEEVELEKLKEELSQEEFVERFGEKFLEDAKRDFPEFENIIIDNDPEGLKKMDMALTMRQVVLFEKFNGNDSFTLYKLMRNIVSGNYEPPKISNLKPEYIN